MNISCSETSFPLIALKTTFAFPMLFAVFAVKCCNSTAIDWVFHVTHCRLIRYKRLLFCGGLLQYISYYWLLPLFLHYPEPDPHTPSAYRQK